MRRNITASPLYPGKASRTAPYRFEYQSTLVEAAVLRAITHHPKEKEFWKERNQNYQYANEEERENALQKSHKRWFEILDLGRPLREVFKTWPLLATETKQCLLIKASSRYQEGAELYVTPISPDVSPRERRSIVIQLTPEFFSQAQQLLTFLRRELLHIVDMLNPDFGYEPDFPKAPAGPTFNSIFQERYRILWDITIDGRLCQKNWLPLGDRDKHLSIFKRAFPLPENKAEELFSHFFAGTSHTHAELVSFAQKPHEWLNEAYSEPHSEKGVCSLCSFPSFDLITHPAEISSDLTVKIKKDFPNWEKTDPVCQQCIHLYSVKS